MKDCRDILAFSHAGIPDEKNARLCKTTIDKGISNHSAAYTTAESVIVVDSVRPDHVSFPPNVSNTNLLPSALHKIFQNQSFRLKQY